MENLILRYKAAKENIERNPELKLRIDEYKRLHVAFQKRAACLLPGSFPSFDEEKAISSIYWGLMLNEQAKEFLESERKLVCAAKMQIAEIADACNIDFSFL